MHSPVWMVWVRDMAVPPQYAALRKRRFHAGHAHLPEGADTEHLTSARAPRRYRCAMCGILGIVTVAGRSPSVNDGHAELMRDRMTHRGPDGRGLWRHEN